MGSLVVAVLQATVQGKLSLMTTSQRVRRESRHTQTGYQTEIPDVLDVKTGPHISHY